MVIHHTDLEDGDGGDLRNAGLLLNIDAADCVKRF
jgi:hypothetical protein